MTVSSRRHHHHHHGLLSFYCPFATFTGSKRKQSYILSTVTFCHPDLANLIPSFRFLPLFSSHDQKWFLEFSGQLIACLHFSRVWEKHYEINYRTVWYMAPSRLGEAGCPIRQPECSTGVSSHRGKKRTTNPKKSRCRGPIICLLSFKSGLGMLLGRIKTTPIRWIKPAANWLKKQCSLLVQTMQKN